MVGPEFSKGTNANFSLSLKFNSMRMKKKCFTELWHLSGHAFFNVTVMQRCLYLLSSVVFHLNGLGKSPHKVNLKKYNPGNQS